MSNPAPIGRPYQAGFDGEGNYYVDGPDQSGECSYHGGTLHSHLRMKARDEAGRAAVIANIAFQQGYLKAQADIRRALGLLFDQR